MPHVDNLLGSKAKIPKIRLLQCKTRCLEKSLNMRLITGNAHQIFLRQGRKPSPNRGCEKCDHGMDRTYESVYLRTNALTTRLRLQLPNRRKIFAIYALTLMYTVASPDPDPTPGGGGQLPNPKSAILR